MKYLLMLSAAALPGVFDPGKKVSWKLDDAGNVVLQDGNPVLVDAEGQERTVGVDTISRLNAENKTHRERAEAAETSLKAFTGLAPDKVADAIKALDTVSKIDQKKLIDAGEVDRVRQEITSGLQTQIDAVNTENNSLKDQLNTLRIDTAFGGSKFISDNVATPLPMVKATFGRNFKYEDGNLVPYDDAGQKVFSKKRLGEIADFDEAMEILITSSPYKDDILKAPSNRGSGNNGDGGRRTGSRYISRADYEKQSPHEQAALAAKARAGEVTITD